MPMNQESLLLISMPNSATTVSQMHIPPKTHFQKVVGEVKKFFCGHSSRMNRRVAEIQIFEKTYLIVIKDETGPKFKMNDSTLFLIGSYAQTLVASY